MARRIPASLAAGLLCLLLSPHSLGFSISATSIDLPWSMLFPILAALAWGPGYGLLAALGGGAWIPFLLWPSNGYANLLTFLTMVLFFSGLGYAGFSRPGRRRTGSLYPYLACFIPGYFILMGLAYNLLFPVVLSLNPPFWLAEGQTSVSTIPSGLLMSFTVKDAINYLFLVIAAETLLQVNPLRRILGMKHSDTLKGSGGLVLLTLAMALLIWTIYLLLVFFLIGGEISGHEDHLMLAFLVMVNAGIIISRMLIHYNRVALEAGQSRRDFLANMSHELRTPLNGIIGMLELLRSHEPRQDQLRLIDLAGRSATHLGDMVNDLLTLTRIGRGVFRLEKSEFDLVALLRDLVDMEQAEARNAGMELVFTTGVPRLMVSSDSQRITQVLLNLISNAFKYAGKGDLEIGLSLGKDIVITVRDHGPGIPEHLMETAFQPFTQLESSYSKQHGGMGAGLNIALGLAGLLGGRLRGEQAPGGGALFVFTLPVAIICSGCSESASAADGTENSQEGRQTAARPLHILVVEDEFINRFFLRTLLERHGHRVSEAGSAESALAELEKGLPDIVLMDIGLPGMSGDEAIRRIRTGFSRNDLPVIAVTAHALKENLDQFLTSGANRVVTKPYGEAQLISAITETLGSRLNGNG